MLSFDKDSNHFVCLYTQRPQVKAEYIADFNPSEFVQTAKLANRYLLVPDSDILSLQNPPPKVYYAQSPIEHAQFIDSFRNASEWMAVPKTMFDLTRSSCDKIGVGYSAFKHQATKCTTKMGRSVMYYNVMFLTSSLE